SLAMEAEGIPADRVGGRAAAAVDDPGVKDLLAWCRVLAHPLDFEHARRLLYRPPVAMPGPRVLELLARFKVERSHAQAPAGESDTDVFIPWVARQCPDDAGVQNLAAVYAGFRARLANTPAADLLYDLALRTDVVHADLLPARERGRRLAAVVSMLRFAFARQKRLDQPGDLAAFLDYWDDLDLREQEGLEESARVDADDQAAIELGAEEDRGVVLITAHAAKGLEFDTVYVPKIMPGPGWFPSSRKSEPRLPLPILTELGAAGDADARHDAEERRLFYVACTRAERRLVLVGNIPKGKSTATNYLLELTTCGLKALETTDTGSVVADFRSQVESSVKRELLDTKARKNRDARRDELAARARAQAAAALEKAFRAAVTAKELSEAESALADAAKTLAIVAQAHATGEPPAWTGKDKALAARAESIAGPFKLAEAGAAPPVQPSGTHLARPRAPLMLSYTSINQFERCPGCWYVKSQMKLEPTPGSEISTGVVVHEALCEFFGRWADADAQGATLPTLDELLIVGRARFMEASEGTVLDRHELERCQEMLRTAYALHARAGDRVHIVEHPELEIRVPLVTESGGHTLHACIDRLERHPEIAGGYRIVDYKTGQEWKKLKEPPADDLQMGIYAIALDRHLNPGDADPPRTPGVAEYWLLATGAVGSISLDRLNREKVRKRIEKAAGGMLNGPYPSSDKCDEGLCRLLTPGIVTDP
ncbi:MAG: PD-(D/E)XK nuclease family protein, partial [Thermoleophilia bacterium]|nr:PD-(D/E)XK nuclease family protein [Thermoleophilia bacterium]